VTYIFGFLLSIYPGLKKKKMLTQFNFRLDASAEFRMAQAKNEACGGWRSSAKYEALHGHKGARAGGLGHNNLPGTGGGGGGHIYRVFFSYILPRAEGSDIC
jgi:hypothetical protein